MVGWETIGKSIPSMANQAGGGGVRRPKLVDVANSVSQLPVMKVLFTKLIELKGDTQTQNSALDSTVIQIQRLLSDDLETQLRVLESENEKSPDAIDESIQVLLDRASSPLQVSSRGVTSTISVLSILVRELHDYNWEGAQFVPIFTTAANTVSATAGATEYALAVLSLIISLIDNNDTEPPAELQNQIFTRLVSLALYVNQGEDCSCGEVVWGTVLSYLEYLSSDDINWVFTDLEELLKEGIYQYPAEVIDCLTSASASGCEVTLNSIVDNHLAAAMSLSSFSPEMIVVILGNIALGIPNKLLPSSYYNVAFDILEQEAAVGEYCCSRHMYASAAIVPATASDLMPRKRAIADKILSTPASLTGLPFKNVVFLIEIVVGICDDDVLPFRFLRSVLFIVNEIYPSILHDIRTRKDPISMDLSLSPELFTRDEVAMLPVLCATCLRVLVKCAEQSLAIMKSTVAATPLTIFDDKYRNICFYEKTISGIASNFTSVKDLPQSAHQLLALASDIRSHRSLKQKSASSIIRSFRSSQCRSGVTLVIRHRRAVSVCVAIQSLYRMRAVYAVAKRLRTDKKALLEREGNWRTGIWDMETRDSATLWEAASQLRQLLSQTMMKRETESRNRVREVAEFTAREIRYRGILVADAIVELVALRDEYSWQSPFSNDVERITQRSNTILMQQEAADRTKLEALFVTDLATVETNEKYYRQVRALFKISLKKRIQISTTEAEERDQTESFLLLKYLEEVDERNDRWEVKKSEARLWSILQIKGIDIFQESGRRVLELEWSRQLKKNIKSWNHRIIVRRAAGVSALAVVAIVAEGGASALSELCSTIPLSPVSSESTISVNGLEATPYLTPLTSDFGGEIEFDPKCSILAASLLILATPCSLISSSLFELRNVVQSIHCHPAHYMAATEKRSTTVKISEVRRDLLFR
eukprot:TRINITY_DN13955_c0_g2_i1.p1 TRINITY_DN13955_c0_g2~~TRINITY_DN13955_c0_g2_i1.p1  ORF type:complete len:934 (+),score=177.24 TRINITY_DN13955_c0_g2_i1:59-2860(+)